MSDHDWLSRHDPAPPAELATAMRTAVEGNAEPTANDLLEAAEHLLENVLRTDCESRSSALDLLTVDALMTHALRIAATDPKLLEEFPEEAMHRVAAHERA